jgi:hypothetical protein
MGRAVFGERTNGLFASPLQDLRREFVMNHYGSVGNASFAATNGKKKTTKTKPKTNNETTDNRNYLGNHVDSRRSRQDVLLTGFAADFPKQPKVIVRYNPDGTLGCTDYKVVFPNYVFGVATAPQYGHSLEELLAYYTGIAQGEHDSLK